MYVSLTEEILSQLLAKLVISNREVHTTNEIANKAAQPTSLLETGIRSEEVGLLQFMYCTKKVFLRIVPFAITRHSYSVQCRIQS